jgi:serine/threonine-protein kinase RsbW
VTEKTPRVRLELESRPESVTLVRGMLAGVGEALDLDAELVDDVRTAVSEACNNAIIHAYGGRTGLLRIECEIEPDRLQVRVRDFGRGMHGVSAVTDRMGVGLAVISALADQAEFTSMPDGGTEVRMAFAADLQKANLPAGVELNGDGWSDGLDGEVTAQVAPTELLSAVLGRISRSLAARARFSVDRLSDLYPVAEAIAAHARDAVTVDRVGFSVASADRRIELTIGPLADGASERLQARLGRGKTGSALALLADDVSAERRGDFELMRVVVADHRGSER